MKRLISTLLLASATLVSQPAFGVNSFKEARTHELDARIIAATQAGDTRKAQAYQEELDLRKTNKSTRANIKRLTNWVTFYPGQAATVALVAAVTIGGVIYLIYKNPTGTLKVVKSPWTFTKKLCSGFWNCRPVSALRTSISDSVRGTWNYFLGNSATTVPQSVVSVVSPIDKPTVTHLASAGQQLLSETCTAAQHAEELLNQAYETVKGGIANTEAAIDKFTHALDFAQSHGVTSNLVSTAKSTLEILRKAATQPIAETAARHAAETVAPTIATHFATAGQQLLPETCTAAQHAEELLNQAYDTVKGGVPNMAKSIDKFTQALDFAQHHGITSKLFTSAHDTLKILRKVATHSALDIYRPNIPMCTYDAAPRYANETVW